MKNVVDGEEEAYVELEDGSVERGDIVVGCDGVHSSVREAMWTIANKSIPGFISNEEKQSNQIQRMPVDEHKLTSLRSNGNDL